MRQCNINESDRLALEAILYAYSCDMIDHNSPETFESEGDRDDHQAAAVLAWILTN